MQDLELSTNKGAQLNSLEETGLKAGSFPACFSASTFLSDSPPQYGICTALFENKAHLMTFLHNTFQRHPQAFNKTQCFITTCGLAGFYLILQHPFLPLSLQLTLYRLRLFPSAKFIPTSDFSLVLQTDQDIILPDSHKGFFLSHFNMGPLPIDTFLPSISLPPECKPLEGRKLACLLLYLLMYVQTLGKCPINIC